MTEIITKKKKPNILKLSDFNKSFTAKDKLSVSSIKNTQGDAQNKQFSTAKKETPKQSTSNNTNQTQSSSAAKVEKPLYLTQKEYKDILTELQTTYPKCFTTPLSILATGIHKQLFKGNINTRYSKTKLRYFFKLYCTTKEYKNGLKIGANRHDLDGNVTGQVTEKEACKHIKT